MVWCSVAEKNTNNNISLEVECCCSRIFRIRSGKHRNRSRKHESRSREEMRKLKSKGNGSMV